MQSNNFGYDMFISVMECDIVWYLPTRLDGITSQKAITFVFTAVRTVYLTLWSWLQAKWNLLQGNKILSSYIAIDLKNTVL
jgi:hypothetical protein